MTTITHNYFLSTSHPMPNDYDVSRTLRRWYDTHRRARGSVGSMPTTVPCRNIGCAKSYLPRKPGDADTDDVHPPSIAALMAAGMKARQRRRPRKGDMDPSCSVGRIAAACPPQKKTRRTVWTPFAEGTQPCPAACHCPDPRNEAPMPSHQKRKGTGTPEILMTGHGIGDTHGHYM